MPEQIKDIRGMGDPFSKTPKVQWPFITTADGPKSLVPPPSPSASSEAVVMSESWLEGA